MHWLTIGTPTSYSFLHSAPPRDWRGRRPGRQQETHAYTLNTTYRTQIDATRVREASTSDTGVGIYHNEVPWSMESALAAVHKSTEDENGEVS